jgi:transmembrane sensor
MSKLEVLLRRLAHEQDRERAESGLPDKLAARFRGVSRPAARRVPRWLALAAALVLVALVVGVRALQKPDALSVTIGESSAAPLVGAWLGAPDRSPLSLDFSDGSRFELTPKSKARVTELGSSARVELANGSLHVRVVPHRAAAWHIDAGPFGVRITGTRFVVSYDPAREVFELAMDEGEVELSGCVFGKGRKLAGGQRVRASCRTKELAVGYRDVAPSRVTAPEAEVASNTPPALTTAPSSEPEVNSPGHVASAPPAPAPLSWQPLARAGKYREAYAELGRLGFEEECKRASSDALGLLADVARKARAPRKAEHALLVLRRRFPGSSDAAIAAFTLGRLEFDEFHGYTKAADWFRTYLKEQPNGAMAREALGRLLEAAYRAGDAASARALSERYLGEYPSGPHAELASRLVRAP